jgi:hypothetical protein
MIRGELIQRRQLTARARCDELRWVTSETTIGGKGQQDATTEASRNNRKVSANR